MKIKAKSSGISEVRKFLGIRQEDLALILGMSRNQLSMSETGKRPLPTVAQIVFADLVVQMHQARKNLKVAGKQITEADYAEVAKSSVSHLKYSIALAERKLENLEKKYQKCLFTQVNADEMQKTLRNDNSFFSKLLKKDKSLPEKILKDHFNLKLRLVGLKAQFSL